MMPSTFGPANAASRSSARDRFYVGRSGSGLVQAALVAGGFILGSIRGTGAIGEIGTVAALGGALWVVVDLNCPVWQHLKAPCRRRCKVANDPPNLFHVFVDELLVTIDDGISLGTGLKKAVS